MGDASADGNPTLISGIYGDSRAKRIVRSTLVNQRACLVEGTCYRFVGGQGIWTLGWIGFRYVFLVTTSA
jgi:hypothetical protein